jgi:hypothetical protein
VCLPLFGLPGSIKYGFLQIKVWISSGEPLIRFDHSPSNSGIVSNRGVSQEPVILRLIMEIKYAGKATKILTASVCGSITLLGAAKSVVKTRLTGKR